MRQIKRLFSLLILTFLCLSSFSQSDICEETASGVFWPIKMGVKRYYGTTSKSYVSYYTGDSLQINSKTYYQEIDEYEDGDKKTTYLREQDGNIYIYDKEKGLEYLELSADITPGHTWEKYDKSWKYTVVDTVSVIHTPYCTYKNLLNIKAEPHHEEKDIYASYFNLYYKRGVGQVGVHVEGKGYSFLSIDKSLVHERSYLMPGCEALATEKERIQCTGEKINDFISKNFNFDGKLKKGTIVLQFAINEEGKAESITATQTIKRAEGQLQEAIRVVKMITFIPRKLNGKPIKTFVKKPISF